MTFERLKFGLAGEDMACAALTARGYAVVERRYRTTHGEIDIIARDGDYLVFVEVKARHGGDFGDPSEAVTLRKQQTLVWMAADYLARAKLTDVPCRFDVVGIDAETHPPAVTIIEDAFRPGW
jgi:putative endonuclease